MAEQYLKRPAPIAGANFCTRKHPAANFAAWRATGDFNTRFKNEPMITAGC